MVKRYLQSLIRRFPNLELTINGLHRDDPQFRSICEEMEIAETARDRWKNMPERADEYQGIFDRLQDEFLDHLTRNTREANLRPLQQGMNDDDRNT